MSAKVHEIGARSGLRVTSGRMVVELRPNLDWDKGKTLEWILDQVAGQEPLLPIHIGDDLTDEDAFDSVLHDGVGIVVRHDEDGDRSTAARFSLADPDHVREFVERLVEQCDIDRQMLQPLVVHVRRLHSRAGAAAGGAVHRGQRLPRHPRLRAGGGRRAVPLSRHLCRRAVQPALRRDRRRARRQREPGEPAELAVAEVPDQRRRLVRHRLRDHPELSAEHGPPPGRAHPGVPVPRPRGPHLPRPAAAHRGDAPPARLRAGTTVWAEDWSGTIEFLSILDGDVRNSGVERYRALSSDHLVATTTQELAPNSALLVCETVQSRIPIAVAARTTVWRGRRRWRPTAGSSTSRDAPDTTMSSPSSPASR